jgi:heme/copper-type cytochrome/quinol oxidase subunit 2
MLKIFLRISIFLGVLFRAAVVLAGDYGLGTAAGDLKNDTDISEIIGNILKPILGLTGTIFFVLVIYAGLKWMTSGGNEESVATAKKIFIAAIIGLIIVLSAYAITSFIGTNLG